MQSGEEIMEQIARLAGARVNDAVRLAFLEEGELGGLDRLDLTALSEFKRGSNGTVELKFIDRLAALEWLAERSGDDPRAKELFLELESGARALRGEEG